MEKKNVIEVRNLSYTYPDAQVPALNNVSFDITSGSWVSILGHNGSGKSTLSKLLDGLILPTDVKSKIQIDGLNLNQKNIWKIRDRIGIVFQNPDNQFVGATVEDDIAFGLENRNIPPDEIKIIIDDVLKKVNMEEYRRREPQTLSGGQKQRVAVAGILAIKPKIIILDESTSMLDPEGRIQILSLIRLLQEEKNITILSITHDVEEVMHSNKVIVLNNGKLLAEASPHEIFSDKKLVNKIKIGMPFIYKMKASLDDKGIKIPKEVNTEEKLVKFLWQLNSKT